ncbi:MAG: glutamine-hydrolyzing carbamoyl-phosphate synthase small subunit [Chlamydiae bacterium]|nr:glutamine-hydrolyzing carbamoyl-phosphate synthase small subunit [Chlamydiota bacterium]MBI3277856.1 glutamine-hydrolyzing carbamoyl-phosphate synthase small subunit [Chlamydiota bacterium]
MKAILVLEDGTAFEGSSFGSTGEKTAEVVFNTSMTGYQEILTDPSYKGQMVAMTYPLIGNYGVNEEDVESKSPQVEAFIIRELCRIPSNWRSTQGLGDYLKKHGIIGIENIDTRALTRILRMRGAMMGIISTKNFDKKKLFEKLKSVPGMTGQDLVKVVTTPKSYSYNEKGQYKVVAVDFGIKTNILRCLESVGCQIQVVSATASSEEILSHKPDGLFLSNGPGDPAAVTYGIGTVRKLLGKLPVFGICLGHQILGLAYGGKTYKLKFGHRGANQPVMDLISRKVAITSQNHGFAVDMGTLNPEEVELTHINLNDKTVEGMRHKKFPIFSVQYHPEASPGPHDSLYLFESFREMMEEEKSNIKYQKSK